MLWLFRFFTGYLFVEFSGDFSEQILNLTAKNRISMWNLHCHKRVITGCVSARNFRALRQIRKGTGVHIHIIRKHGLPFLTRGYRKRYGLMMGFLLFFAVLQFLSSFIWTVEVSGNVNTPAADITAACVQMGIHEGVFKTAIVSGSQSQTLLLNCPTLAWASLNVEGCVLNVNVSEIKNSVPSESGAPCNLKSSADGIIKKIDVLSGNTVVRVGDAVKSGDLLVSGIFERMSSTEFVHSSGSVFAQTRRVFTSSGTFQNDLRQSTGKVHKRSVLCVFGIKIPLYVGSVRGESSTTVSLHQATLFGKPLPLSLTTKKYDMMQTTAHTYSAEELYAILKKNIEEQISAAGIGEYQVTDEQRNETEDGLTVSVTLTAQENIAVPEKILLNGEN